tara:strand:- start:260 stop:430 length:171 start_codon:yes stop_codon:yes gene_type:complete
MYINGIWVCEKCHNYGKYMANLGGRNFVLFCKCKFGKIKEKIYKNLLKKEHDHNSN